MIGRLRNLFHRGAKSRFGRDALMLQLAAGVNMGSGFVTSIVLFRFLGVYGYGNFAEATNLYNLIYFLGNVGFSQICIARVAEAMGRGDEEDAARWLGFFVKAYGILSSILLVIGMLVAPWLGYWIMDDWQVGVWAGFLCLSGPLSLPFYMVQVALHGTRRMRILAEMENLKEMLRSFLVVCGVLLIGDTRGAIAGEIGGSALSVILAYFAYRKAMADCSSLALPGMRSLYRGARAVTSAELWELTRRGALISVNKNFQALMPTVLPRLLLGHFATSREVGYLNLAQNLMKLPLMGLQGVSRTLMPALGQLKGSGDIEKLRHLMQKIMLLSGGLVSAATAAWGIALLWLLPILYGESARPASQLLPWLFIANAIAGFAVGAEAFFIVVDRVKVAVKISIVSLMIFSPFGFFFIWQWTTVGAAMAVALVHLTAAASIAYIFYYLRRERELAKAKAAHAHS